MSRVRLVGIGPGHPGLATVQAVEAIKDAEIIRCCDGCGAALLHLASAHADIGPLESAEEVVRLARTGRKVAVLFPGNPYAFSNGSDIAEKLERAEIDFEAVPGLIVELAAPVMSGIPLTIEGAVRDDRLRTGQGRRDSRAASGLRLVEVGHHRADGRRQDA